MGKIVITGGPYSGKTTTIDELQRQGFSTVPEVAIQVIDELNKKYGIEGQKQWRLENFGEFQLMVANRQIDLESEADSTGLVFYDRGLHDCIAYCNLRDIEVPTKLLSLAGNQSYDRVFLFETLSDFNSRGETGRMLDKEASIKIKYLIKNTYEEYGHTVIEVPETTLERRIEIIKGRL